MNRSEAKQLLPIIKAFSEGKTVEYYNQFSVWEDSKGHLDFCNSPSRYRIKPEPTYRPFANAEECWNEMQKHQPFGWFKSYNGDNYYLLDKIDNDMCFASLVKGLIFADGQPFGVKEEEG